MTVVILNPKSCGGRARKHWQLLSEHIPHDQVVQLSEFMNQPFVLKANQNVIAAGGDGCLHAVVNKIIADQGITALSEIAVGYIGLGSNNSFLQPLSDRKRIHGLPIQIGPLTQKRDLVEIKIEGKSTSQIQFMVSNASSGFLAYANQTFNSNPTVQFLKKWSISIADIASFLYTLKEYNPIEVRIKRNSSSFEFSKFTNLHWLKSPFFTKDLHFPLQSSLDSGNFDHFYLKEKSPREIFIRFFKMLFLQEMQYGYDKGETVQQMEVESVSDIPIEIDGEVYFGNRFALRIHQQALKVLI